jgi:hypothetical protein
MRIIVLLLFLCFSTPVFSIEEIDFNTSSSHEIPITVTVRSIRDLRVKEGQKIRIGQVLAPKPLEAEAPKGYTSKKHEREVEKQKRIVSKFRQIVEEENLPKVLIDHEEAKLRDLEFQAKEFQLLSNKPTAPKETVYRSPVNGTIQKISPLSSSDGRLTVEIVVELD